MFRLWCVERWYFCWWEICWGSCECCCKDLFSFGWILNNCLLEMVSIYIIYCKKYYWFLDDRLFRVVVLFFWILMLGDFVSGIKILKMLSFSRCVLSLLFRVRIVIVVVILDWIVIGILSISCLYFCMVFVLSMSDLLWLEFVVRFWSVEIVWYWIFLLLVELRRLISGLRNLVLIIGDLFEGWMEILCMYVIVDKIKGR